MVCQEWEERMVNCIGGVARTRSGLAWGYRVLRGKSATKLTQLGPTWIVVLGNFNCRRLLHSVSTPRILGCVMD